MFRATGQQLATYLRILLDNLIPSVYLWVTSERPDLAWMVARTF